MTSAHHRPHHQPHPRPPRRSLHHPAGQLADRIGVTRQTVNAIEGDKYSPSLEVAFRIAAVFAVPLETVFQYVHP